MIIPRVLNRKRLKITPTNSVYVGRPTKWGNPFKVGAIYNGKTLTQQDAVDQYRDWLLHSDQGRQLLAEIEELRGKHLICWCKPLACHADVLLELANKRE